MCVVSMISDHYMDKWKDDSRLQTLPYYPPAQIPPFDHYNFVVSKTEFDKLKAEVEEMKLLLKRAIKYDEVNNEPHCELAEKKEVLRKIAELVGVNLDDIFPDK